VDHLGECSFSLLPSESSQGFLNKTVELLFYYNLGLEIISLLHTQNLQKRHSLKNKQPNKKHASADFCM
jgi:hypothetical protein